MDFTLRDYQENGIEAIRGEFRKGHKRVLLCMPTGAGKTKTAAAMMGQSYAKGKSMFFVTDREELAEQGSDAFEAADVPHSFILPGSEADKFGRAYVGTIQSFLAWRTPDRITHKARRWTPPKVDFIIIDEAHRVESQSFQTLIHAYPDAYVLGLTATPMRGDGRGLGNTFQGMVTPITMRELQQRGLLVPARYFVPNSADLSKLRMSKTGDYTKESLEEWAKDNPQLVGDAVENFARVCPERSFVAFAPDIATSRAFQDRMNAAGFSCAHVDGKTPKGERRELMAAFRAGEIQGLSSVNIAVEGLDVPHVSAVILLRPTKSERIYVQAVGRGLRSHPDKTNCVVLDHAGVFAEFGPAESFIPPPLHARKGKQVKGGKRQRKQEKAEVICEGILPDGAQCCAVLIGTHICPECGHEHVSDRAPKHWTAIPAELEEMTSEGGGR